MTGQLETKTQTMRRKSEYYQFLPEKMDVFLRVLFSLYVIHCAHFTRFFYVLCIDFFVSFVACILLAADSGKMLSFHATLGIISIFSSIANMQSS